MAIDTEKLKTVLLKHLARSETNLYQFSKQIGIPQPTLHRFIKGDNKIPSVKTINKILAGLEPWEIATNNILNLEKR